MNIDRLKNLVRGIADPEECKEAMRMLSDAESYGDLQLQVITLQNQLADARKQLEDEKYDHLQKLALARKGTKPESQIQAELLADMHRCNVIRAGSFSDVRMMQDAIRNAINAAAIRSQVLNQMQALLEKKGK